MSSDKDLDDFEDEVTSLCRKYCEEHQAHPRELANKLVALKNKLRWKDSYP